MQLETIPCPSTLGARISGGRRRFWVTAQKGASALGGRSIISIDAVTSETPPDTLAPASTGIDRSQANRFSADYLKVKSFDVY